MQILQVDGAMDRGIRKFRSLDAEQSSLVPEVALSHSVREGVAGIAAREDFETVDEHLRHSCVSLCQFQAVGMGQIH